MIADFRTALRSLARAPAFTGIAVLTLALGIGLSTTIFNAVNPLLFRALPFRDTDSLVTLYESNSKQGLERMSVAYADYAHWRRDNRVFSDIGIWGTTNFALADTDQPERVEGCQISATLFDLLGLQPIIGRAFMAGEDQPGAPSLVLLGHGLWQRRFGSDPALVGRTITLNGRPHTVVGIMPPRMRFPNDADLWVPLVIAAPEQTHGNHSYQSAARLKPGVTLTQAEADLASIHERIAEESPATNRYINAKVRPITEGFIDRDLRAMGWTMLGGVVFVLGVACANVASLYLTRSLGRQRELAIRTALGANRFAAIRLLLAESLVLSAVGGIAGVLLSLWGLEAVVRLVPIQIPYWIDFTFDSRVLAFAVGVSLLNSLIFGLVPAWQASQVDVVTGLNEAARGATGGRDRHRLRSLFVVSEVALASLLLCGTGLMIRSLLNLQRVAPGFNTGQLAVFYADLGASPTSTATTRIEFVHTALERLRNLPGVVAATACSSLPLSGRNNGQGYTIEGRPPSQPGPNPVGNLRIVPPGYFLAMQIPLVAGREFTAADHADGAKVIIIDAAFARQQFGDTNPLGQRIRWPLADSSTTMEIVGVAADVKHSGLDRETRPGFYVPYSQNARRSMGFVVRTASGDPLQVLPEIRHTIHELDPLLPIYRTQTMDDMIEETYWIRRFISRMLIGFAVIALVLATVGIAGVVGFAAVQRTREIGIRIALGAQPGDVLLLLVGQGMRLVMLGLGLGMMASLGLSQALASQLYGIGAIEPQATLVSVVAFLCAALLACWLPARRATRINPVDALRAE